MAEIWTIEFQDREYKLMDLRLFFTIFDRMRASERSERASGLKIGHDASDDNCDSALFAVLRK